MRKKIFLVCVALLSFYGIANAQCSGVQMAPYTYSFEDQPAIGTNFSGNVLINNCWMAASTGNSGFRSEIDGTGSGSTGPLAAFDATVYVYTEASGSSNGDTATLTSPQIDISTLTSPELAFFYHAYGSLTPDMEIQIGQNNVFVGVDTIFGPTHTSSAAAWSERIIDLSAYSGIIQVRFRAAQQGCCAGDFALDFVRVRNTPTCPAVTNPTVSNIMSSSVDVAWTPNGSPTSFTIRYAQASAPNNYTVVTGIASSPYTLNNLNVATDYIIEVRAECGSNDSSEWRSVTATTACGIFTAPYLGNFSQYTGNVPNRCWEEASSGHWSTGPSGSTFSNWSVDGFQNNGFTGAARMNMDNNIEDWMVSAPIAIPASPTYELRYAIVATDEFDPMLQNRSMGNDDTLVVTVSADMGNTWTALKTYSKGIDSFPPTPTREKLDLSAFAGDTIIIGFYADRGPSGGNVFANEIDVFIDDVEVNLPSTCPEPSITSVTNITAFTALVSWTSPGSATAWQILAVPSGSLPIPSNGVIANATSTSSVISGLNGLTDYDVYVRSICGSSVGDTSIWSFSTAFSTPCAPDTVPYLNDFSSTDPCWVEYTDGDLLTGPLQPNAGNWVLDEWLNMNGSGNNAASISLASNFVDDWNVTNDYALPSSPNFELSFDIAAGTGFPLEFGNFGSDDEVYLLVSDDYGTTWNVMDVWNRNNHPTELGSKVYYDLTQYANDTVRFAFYATDGAVDDPEFIEINVDNFLIDTLPPCPPPFSHEILNVRSDAIQFSWRNRGAPSMWEVQYGAPGFTPGTGLSQTISGSSQTTITPLSPSFTYEFYIRVICGPNDSSAWYGPFNIATLCAPVSVPPTYTEGFDNNSTYGINEFPTICWGSDGDYESSAANLSFNRMARTDSSYVFVGTNADNWLYLPSFDLDSGSVYSLEYWYITDGSPGWAYVRGAYGLNRNRTAMTNPIGSAYFNPQNTTYQRFYEEFIPQHNGETYVGIHVFSNSSANFLSIDDIEVDLVSPVGINEIDGKEIKLFNVFPNPNNGIFNIVNTSVQNDITMRITDLQGKIVMERVMNMGANAMEEINMNDVSSGLYIVNISTDNHSENHKIIVR